MTKDNFLVIDIEATGNPWNGKIICIGTRRFNSSEIKTFYDDQDETLIMDFLKYFNTYNFSKLIGYNVAFDYRFIVTKCLKYRIKLNGFQYVKLLDIMKILKEVRHGHNLNETGKLNQWSKYILGRGKLAKDGSIKDLLTQGRLLEVLEYNRNDVDITYQLFNRINEVMDVR